MTTASRPDVAVVVATNRHSPFLREALASVEAQTLGSWEGIVVDDGVPDAAALADLVAEFPRFRTVGSGRGGVSHARNVGAAEVTGEFLAFLDDDDRWHPTRLEAYVAAMRESAGSVAAYGPVEVIDESGAVVVPGTPGPPPSTAAVVRRDAWIACPNLMVRRSAFDEVGGFDRRLRLAEDLDLILRLAAWGDFVSVSEVLVGYRHHASNTTARGRDLATAIHRIVLAQRAAARAAARFDVVGHHDASLWRNLRYAAWVVRTDLRWSRLPHDTVWWVALALDVARARCSTRLRRRPRTEAYPKEGMRVPRPRTPSVGRPGLTGSDATTRPADRGTR